MRDGAGIYSKSQCAITVQSVSLTVTRLTRARGMGSAYRFSFLIAIPFGPRVAPLVTREVVYGALQPSAYTRKHSI